MDFEIIREGNGQRGDCKIKIKNQKTRMDRLFLNQGEISRGPSEAMLSSKMRYD